MEYQSNNKSYVFPLFLVSILLVGLFLTLTTNIKSPLNDYTVENYDDIIFAEDEIIQEESQDALSMGMSGLNKPTIFHHIVQEGDTLKNIAKKYNIKYESILEKNPNIKNPNIINPGQVIDL